MSDSAMNDSAYEAGVETHESHVRVVLNAWNHSEADHGERGPFVRLSVSGGGDAVLSPGQVEDLRTNLSEVLAWAERHNGS